MWLKKNDVKKYNHIDSVFQEIINEQLNQIWLKYNVCKNSLSLFKEIITSRKNINPK
jgi:hypothetical protein